MIDKLKDFDCPMCHVKIPVEYAPKKIKHVNYRGQPKFFCLGCAEEWEALVAITMEKRMAEKYSAVSDLTPKAVLAIRREQKEVQAEDEKLVDEEVDVMDGDKTRKLFRKKGDRHEQAKQPLQVMQEKFIKGLEQERSKKIIVPNTFKGGKR